MILSDRALLLSLDDAWPNDSTGLPVADVRSWGPHLRFSAPPRLVEQFYREHGRDLAAPFLLYGSGDFHHLTALRLRSVAGPMVLARTIGSATEAQSDAVLGVTVGAGAEAREILPRSR